MTVGLFRVVVDGDAEDVLLAEGLCRSGIANVGVVPGELTPDLVVCALERQLSAFSTNVRANEIMHENSKNLTPTEIAEVAAFLAAQ